MSPLPSPSKLGSAALVAALSAALALATPAALSAQAAPPVDWITDVGFPAGWGYAFGGRIAVDSQDHVYVGARPIGGYQLARVSPSGQVLWTRLVTGEGFTKSFDMAVDSQDNAILIGYDEGTFSFVTTKFDTAGNLLWKRVRKDGLKDEGKRVAVDAQDNVYVSGHSTNESTFAVEFMTIKYDPDGNEEWLVRGPFGQPFAIGATPDGRVAISGDSGNSFVTVSYDTDGGELWSDVYAPAMTRPYGLAMSDSGDVYVCGAGGPAFTGLIVHYDPSGAIAWVGQGTGPQGGWDLYRAIALDPFGDLVVSGQAFGVGYLDWTVTKFDAAGNEVWNRTVTGFESNDEVATGVTTDAAGAVYVSGGLGQSDCQGAFPGSMDGAVAKFDAAGTALWTRKVPCTSTQTGDVVLDSAGNVYSMGYDRLSRLNPACAGVSWSEVVRNGTPPNPSVLNPGSSDFPGAPGSPPWPPITGGTWGPWIDHATFATDAILDFVGVSPGPAINSPILGVGTLLCAPQSAVLFSNANPGFRIPVPVPFGCNFAGLPLCTQGGSVTPGGVELTNALDIVVGTF